jgi:hypothetical protein
MKRTYRALLPFVVGTLSVPLMAWDIHNQCIIESMGMAWDTGAPLWPYQTPDTLLLAINTPAYPLGNLATYGTAAAFGPLHYVALAPAILLWWWVVGMFIDRWRSRICEGKGWVWTSLLLLLAILLMWMGMHGLAEAFQWWWRYSRQVLSVSDLIMLRLAAPSVWCLALCVVLVDLAVRRIARIRRAPLV